MSDFSDLEFPIRRVPRMPPGQKTRYVPNRTSFGAFIKSDQVRDPTEAVARDIALLAAANTTGGGGKKKRGLHARVRNGFKVKKNAGFLKVSGNVRVKVEVVNNADAALLEFGARGLARQRMLGRAGAAFGDFKPEGGPA